MSIRTRLLTATAIALLPVVAHAADLAFSPVPFAADDAAKRQVLASSSVTIDGKEYPIAYHVMARSGDKIGDACDPVGAVGGRSFDLVYSNSVIEHVGGHQRRELFAQAVRDLAPSHWVQTPYRYFPLEPFWLFSAFQFLPLPSRA